MGTLTEYYKYLSVSPDKLTEFKQTLSHLNITEELKAKRKELKLWENNEE